MLLQKKHRIYSEKIPDLSADSVSPGVWQVSQLPLPLKASLWSSIK